LWGRCFRRPGGNITGISLLSADLAGRRLQLLSEMLLTRLSPAIFYFSIWSDLFGGAALYFRYIFQNLGNQISERLSIFRRVQAMSNPKQHYDLRIRDITVLINIPSEL
jgi:hypothetical protein